MFARPLVAREPRTLAIATEVTKLHVHTRSDMRALLSTTLLTLVASSLGCSKGDDRSTGEVTRASAERPVLDSAPPTVLAGDRVVIESAMATFVEGVVASVSRDKARVQLAGGGEVSERPLGDLYAPSSNKHPVLLEGSYAVCHMPSGIWRGCRIETVGPVIRVADDESATFDLAQHDVLAATPVTELNVRQRFERSARRRAFREGARSAGRPRISAGWRPEMNARVLVLRDGAWVGAQVKGVKKGQVRVEWDADHRVSDARASDVAPEPPVDFAPTVGTYVLARPAAGGRVWSVMRVESTGISSLELSDELGDRHHVAIRDVMPLERGR